MHMGVRTGGVMTEQNVELNYEQNYVRLSTPGRDARAPVVMIHNYNMVNECLKHNFKHFKI